jgi:methyl-accepting chemotaxis protein
LGSLLVDVQKGVAQIERVGKRLQGILDFSNTLSDHMQGIVQAAEQSAGEVESISTRLAEMQDELGEFERQMGSISKQSMELCELGEGMHEQLADLDLDTIHGRMFKVAQAAAAKVRKVFEEAVATGKIGESDLFDRNYRPIASTNPQKYNSRFDSFTDRTLPAIQERVLATHPEIIYAICTDDKGYVPTHNDKFAKPPTGNYEVDLINSRSKRVFNDRTGSRCGSHTRKMLLQTYKRDTGEIMHDLSVPIHIGGRHWGGFRMGYKAA